MLQAQKNELKHEFVVYLFFFPHTFVVLRSPPLVSWCSRAIHLPVFEREENLKQVKQLDVTLNPHMQNSKTRLLMFTDKRETRYDVILHCIQKCQYLYYIYILNNNTYIKKKLLRPSITSSIPAALIPPLQQARNYCFKKKCVFITTIYISQ